ISNTVSLLRNIGSGPPVAMTVDMDPNTLNLNSLGRWVTCYLEPPAPFTASQIDVGSIRFDRSLPVDPSAPIAIGDHNHKGIPDLMVKLDRALLELTLGEGAAVPVTVTGNVGIKSFVGTDVIRVDRVKITAPTEGSILT